MKKTILLLAGLACFGLLASCKQEPQEIVIDYKVNKTQHMYYGTVKATVISLDASLNQGSAGLYTVTVDENKLGYVLYSEGNVSFSGGVASQYKTNAEGEYTLSIPLKITPYGSSTPTSNMDEITIVKMSDGYYNAQTMEKLILTMSGSFKDGTFTLSGVIKTNNYVYTYITFTRK